MTNKTIKRFALAVAIIAAIGTLLMVPPAWLGIPEFRGLIGWPPQPPNPPQTQPPQKPDGSNQNQNKREDERKPYTSDQRSIDGEWASGTSGSIYYLVSLDSEHFNIYIDDPDRGRVPIGSGTRRLSNIVASLLVLSKNRTANLNLTLSEDGQTMEGTFAGSDPREKGYLIFRKLTGLRPISIGAY